MALAKGNLLPAWTLFCFKEVTANADDSNRPKVLAYVSDDAVLLNPKKTENGYKGLLVARESASKSIREMRDLETGEVISLSIPFIHTKVIAEEDSLLYFR